MVDFEVGVVIPCAGSSERMGGSTPKQYTLVMGKPLFLYPLEELLSLKFIRKVVMVVDNIERTTSVLQEHGLADCQKITLVLGAASRHRSIKAGLQELQRCLQVPRGGAGQWNRMSPACADSLWRECKVDPRK